MSLWSLIVDHKKNTSFLQWSITGCANHTPMQVSCSVIVEKHKAHCDFVTIGFVCFFLVLFCFVLSICVFPGYLASAILDFLFRVSDLYDYLDFCERTNGNCIDRE